MNFDPLLQTSQAVLLFLFVIAKAIQEQLLKHLVAQSSLLMLLLPLNLNPSTDMKPRFRAQFNSKSSGKYPMQLESLTHPSEPGHEIGRAPVTCSRSGSRNQGQELASVGKGHWSKGLPLSAGL